MNKIRLLCAVAVLCGCIFLCPEKSVQAAAPQGCVQAVMFTEQPLGDDVPADAVKPINKGKKYIATIVTFVGWAFIVFGIIFFGLSWMSHQTDQRVIGIVATIVGGLVALAPTVAEWLIS